MTSITTTTTSTYHLDVDGIGPVELSVTDRGQGRPVLLLHGGAGPQSVTAFADLMAERAPVRVLVPVHPGFGGTPRPDALATVSGLAAVYVALLDQLNLHHVMVIGNSIGGWMAAEVALVGSPRVDGLVLIDAAGIAVEDHPVADFFSLTMDQVVELSYHDPDSFRIDTSVLPAAQAQIMAGNRSALSVFGGTAMADPTLRGRLGQVAVPTLVVWGESDRIVDPDYGRAYARAIPGARFILLARTGHVPQLETPDALLDPVAAFVQDTTD
jgi:pimeloyl-ACP methyl ester carboxylesterase